MAHYMLQASFTSEAWVKMLNEPQNREQAIRPVIEKLGGKLLGYWFAFGESDAVVIVQMPDNVSAAAASLAAAAGGSVKSVKTTPLMSVEEGMQAMRKAGGAGYRAPGPPKSVCARSGRGACTTSRTPPTPRW